MNKLHIKQRDDLCLKYVLNTHLIEKYRDEYSVLYEIVRYVVNKNIDESGYIDEGKLKIRGKDLSNIFKKDFLELNKEYIKTSIMFLVKNGYLINSEDNIKISETGLLKFYKRI